MPREDHNYLFAIDRPRPSPLVWWNMKGPYVPRLFASVRHQPCYYEGTDEGIWAS